MSNTIHTPFGPFELGQRVKIRVRVSTANILRTQVEDSDRMYIPHVGPEHTMSFNYTVEGQVDSCDGVTLCLQSHGDLMLVSNTLHPRVIGVKKTTKVQRVPCKGVVNVEQL